MAHAHTTHEADCNSPARCYSGALLLLAIGPNTAALAWDALTVPVSGYRIYYGTAPGTDLQPVGNGVNVPKCRNR